MRTGYDPVHQFLGFAPFPTYPFQSRFFPAHGRSFGRPDTVSVLGHRLTAINERAVGVVMVAVAPRGASGPIGHCPSFAASKGKGNISMIIQDIMSSPVTTVQPSTSIADAARLMLEQHISGLPVVDADGKIVGLVSESDFLRRSELGTERQRSKWLEFFIAPGKAAQEYVAAHGRLVGEVMTSQVTTVSPYAPINEAVELMERDHVKRLPVVFDDELIGVVARSDLLRALVGTLSPGQASLQDGQIAAAVVRELRRQSWTSNGSIRVAAADGVVTLSGTIFDERERLAAKVAAENVPGVKAVIDDLTWIDPNLGIVVA
jgi:CBS domain-containing protein